MPSRKVGAFCRLFFAKEQRKALKRKPNRNLQVNFFAVCQIGTACNVPTTSFQDHIMFDSNTEQGTDGLCFFRQPVKQLSHLNYFIMKNLYVKPLN